MNISTNCLPPFPLSLHTHINRNTETYTQPNTHNHTHTQPHTHNPHFASQTHAANGIYFESMKQTKTLLFVTQPYCMCLTVAPVGLTFAGSGDWDQCLLHREKAFQCWVSSSHTCRHQNGLIPLGDLGEFIDQHQ